MSNLVFRIAALAFVIAGPISIGARAQIAGAPPATIPPWGFDLAGADFAAKPGDDFFRYGNGRWYDQAVIPPDRSSDGVFAALSVTAEARVHEILERGAEGVDPSVRADAAKIGALYAAFMDEARAEALDAQPIAPFLEKIRSVSTQEQFAELMGSGGELAEPREAAPRGVMGFDTQIVIVRLLGKLKQLVAKLERFAAFAPRRLKQ